MPRKLGPAVASEVLRPELAAALGGECLVREIEIAAKLAHSSRCRSAGRRNRVIHLWPMTASRAGKARR